MVSQKKNVEEFLNDIPDAKLRNFAESEDTLYECYASGYRLDYQGLNTNPGEKPFVHRLYIQPISGSKSQSVSKRVKRNQKNGSVTARCHASDKATPTEIRGALLASYDVRAKIIGYAPPK
ncbi:hypothetical protein G7054_g325 [Neopestalotiopsis clavispora]|nr:hypothetical protein G7054_g325 [Neopestalotiopsis clavispora]